MASEQKDITKKYKKLSQREHILMRPGMYIGNPKPETDTLFVCGLKDSEMSIFQKEITFSYAFIKLFDEALTNAIDHSNRDETVDKIKVVINKDSGEISVWNNGKGIPVVVHPEYKMYIPEMIFSEFLSGSNYDDSEQRIVAGTNGLGIKLVVLFSSYAKVETIDTDTGKKFIQIFSDNMSKKSKAKITTSKASSYTRFTYIPDFSKFDMKHIDDDTELLLNKRVFDCVASTRNNVSVFLNGTKIKGKGLVDYSKYLFGIDTRAIQEPKYNIYDFNKKCVYSEGELPWEYIVFPSESFKQISFVNGICTTQGGRHVDYIMNQIITKLKAMILKKKKIEVKNNTIKENIFILLKATVVNPTFSSQTKEQLTNNSTTFGYKVEVGDDFITKIYKSAVVQQILTKNEQMMSVASAKTDGRKVVKVRIPNLEDATWAGTSKGSQCVLMLTEGLSALTFGLWGRGVVGNERFGAFPLRGKLLNVRDASTAKTLANEEITNLKKIIGLKDSVDYKDTKSLRYGKVMCLTDADTDGIHITALIINLFSAKWPSLFKMGFIQSLRTPIIKAVKNSKVIEFYTEQDYHKWQEATGKAQSQYKIKYFKGLGTSQKSDAKELFKRVDNLTIDFVYKDSKCDDAMLLAFEKKTTKSGEKWSDMRKKWLCEYNPNVCLDSKIKHIPYQDYINNSLIHFSVNDNIRSIPCVVDGLKPSQRKIMYYMLMHNITNSVKVAQLSGYISAETAYHHGEQSLNQTIVSMAQDFVGSNNINLLYPNGNFGCLDPETLVLMYSGGLKRARDIVVGDILVGDDGTKRKVLKTTSGIDRMYQVNIANGDNYTVNSSHILSLKYIDIRDGLQDRIYNKVVCRYYDNVNKFYKERSFETREEAEVFASCNSEIIDITLAEYLALPSKIQRNFRHIQYNNKLNFDKKSIPINAKEYGRRIGTNNKVNDIYDDYIFNSVNTVRNFFKGFIETSKNKLTSDTEMCIDISRYDFLVRNKIILVAKIIGFVVVNDIDIIILKGNINKILGIKTSVKPLHNSSDILNTFEFNVFEVGIGEFCGWQTDSNERFLLGNMIITHNSRLSGGKDAASPRYIYTNLTPMSKRLFMTEDNNILKYLEDDGQSVEPEYFVPTLPMVLVNGCNGIGTGFSTFIPSYNPKDLSEILLKLLNGEIIDSVDIQPYFNGFKGSIVEASPGVFDTIGVYTRMTTTKVLISELPIGTWVSPYKEFLEGLITNTKTDNGILKDVINDTKDENDDIRFVIEFKTKEQLDSLINNNEIVKVLKLSKRLSTHNMYLLK